MACCCKAAASGSGPLPEKPQTIQGITACANIKPFYSETSQIPPFVEILPEKSTINKISAATDHLWDHNFTWWFCCWKINLRSFIPFFFFLTRSFLSLLLHLWWGKLISPSARLMDSLVLLLTAGVMQANKQRKAIHEEGWERVSISLDNSTQPFLSMVIQRVELPHLSTSTGGEDCF